jgi:hypothetical protein
VVYNQLFDLGPPAATFNRLRTAHEAYVVTIFQGVVEISESLETLDDIELMVSRFPLRKTRISRERYLRFLVEAYFGEIYILKERLIRYLTRIGRQFKRDDRRTEVRDSERNLADLVNTVLRPFVKARGSHVHVMRLEDEGINRLDTIALLSKGSDQGISSAMKVLYRQAYPGVRTKWKEKISTYNKVVRRLLDDYSDALWKLLFEESSGKLRLPEKLPS